MELCSTERGIVFTATSGGKCVFSATSGGKGMKWDIPTATSFAKELNKTDHTHFMPAISCRTILCPSNFTKN